MWGVEVFFIRRMSVRGTVKQVMGKIYIYGIYRAILAVCTNRTIIWSAFLWYFCNYVIMNTPIHRLRVWGFRNILKNRIGDGCFLHIGCLFYGNITVGNNSVIGRKCTLIGDISVGNNVSITAECYIFSESHDKDSSSFAGTSKPISIEDYAWLGARALVLPGVVIGRGAILGAASTATKNIPPYTVFAGTPAKQVGERSHDLSYTLQYYPYFN